MATYKKNPRKGGKSSQKNIEENSTTAEVFNSLDSSASRSEQWVSKNQTTLLGIIGVVVLSLLIYMAYSGYIKEPKEKIAANLMSFPRLQFNEAINAETKSRDSILKLAINGNQEKVGFLSISKNYGSTSAGNLANYYAGISYQKMNNYEKALEHLKKFSSNDELLEPIAKGAMGDIYADQNKLEKALKFYKKAAKSRDNNLTTPLFLFKAGNISVSLKKYKEAVSYFERIKNQYPDAEEATDIDSYLNIAKFSI
jgi:tetratricopeptide (TPR) repeat protein